MPTNMEKEIEANPSSTRTSRSHLLHNRVKNHPSKDLKEFASPRTTSDDGDTHRDAHGVT